MALKVGELYGVLSLDKKNFDKGISDGGKSFGGFSKLIIGGAALAVTAIAGIGLAALKLGTDFKSGVDEIRAGTGATGQALEDLTKTFGETAKRVPEDMTTIGKVIADLNTRTGATGETLEDMAVSLLDLSRITKTDVNENVAKATRLFGDWSIAGEDQNEILNQMFRVSQNTGIGVTELMDTVVQFGSPLRLLGFDLQTSAALLGKWEKEGVNTSTALTGLKFSVKTLAKEGIPANKMAEEMKERIMGIKESTDPVNEAIALFGLRAGPDLAAAILEGRFEIDELVNAMVNGTDTINAAANDTKDFGELWSQAFNSVTVAVGEALLPILRDMLGWVTEHMPEIQAILGQVGEGMTVAVALIGDAVTWFMDNIMPGLLAVFEKLSTDVMPGVFSAFDVITKNVIPAFGDVIKWIVDNIMPPITEIFNAYVENILPALGDAFAFVQKWIKDNWPLISKIVGQVAGAVKSAFEIVANIIKAVFPIIREIANVLFPILGAAASFLGEVITRAFDLIGAIWQTAADIADTVVTAIFGSWEGMTDFFKGLWKGINDVVKAGINFFIGLINGMIDFVNKIQIHIPGFETPFGSVAKFDWNGLNLPKIPKLAVGTPNFPGGWAMLGETGPELARLPRGTEVLSANDTASLLGGGGPMIGTQNVYGVMPGDVERETRRAFRRQALTWALEGR